MHNENKTLARKISIFIDKSLEKLDKYPTILTIIILMILAYFFPQLFSKVLTLLSTLHF